jgi:hypothetical protein
VVDYMLRVQHRQHVRLLRFDREHVVRRAQLGLWLARKVT